jgi:GTP-binding protein HflX
MTHETAPPRARAVLVGVQVTGVSAAEHTASMRELRRLVTTLGHDVIGEVSQRRAGLHGGVVLGEGKLAELATWTGGSGEVGPRQVRRPQKKDAREADDVEALEDDDLDDDDALDAPDEDPEEAWAGDRPAGEALADLVVVDHELSPMQFRNLASATGARVIDRTGVIVEIFHRHASSPEAKLQVELARLHYVAPRMRDAAGGFDRQAGKGAGESQIELDRRKIRDRIAEIKEQLIAIERARSQRRARRQDVNRVALVGYTNAGKSSWMRALTGSPVLVADKLFATLDTTVRAMYPEPRPRILVSDTVGFIQKLPHDLVASFRSTLDEALEAGLLVYVVDASDPAFRQQLGVTREVLHEIGADEVPWGLLLNKADALDAATREALAVEFPDALQVSSRDPADVTRVREWMIRRFVDELAEVELFVPWRLAAVAGEIHAHAHVIAEEHGELGTTWRIRAPDGVVARLRGMVGEG